PCTDVQRLPSLRPRATRRPPEVGPTAPPVRRDARPARGRPPCLPSGACGVIVARAMAGTDVTHILDAAAAGDPHAAERLLPLVYDELRKLAAQRMARESPGQTL